MPNQLQLHIGTDIMISKTFLAKKAEKFSSLTQRTAKTGKNDWFLRKTPFFRGNWQKIAENSDP
jgi:hypothetical protein